MIINLDNAKDETEMKTQVSKGTELLNTLSEGDCKALLKKRLDETRQTLDFPYNGKLGYNETITLKIVRIGLDEIPIDTLTYTFNTEEKTRWLVHYGLTYAPSIISKVDHFHSLADTSVANKYTITKDNKNGPKPWDNISATINFTYPFHGDSGGFDGGFTAGFGISTGFGLSGQAGLSAIIGDNIILSSGVVLMQKQKLKGEYKEGQIIKENLSSDALHEKVWLPEVFFTIGFRFGSNPFASKTTPAATTTPAK